MDKLVNAGETINHPFIDASQITSYLHDHLFLSAHFHLSNVLQTFINSPPSSSSSSLLFFCDKIPSRFFPHHSYWNTFYSLLNYILFSPQPSSSSSSSSSSFLCSCPQQFLNFTSYFIYFCKHIYSANSIARAITFQIEPVFNRFFSAPLQHAQQSN